MVYNFQAKILHIDLSNDRVWKKSISKNIIRKYIGSRGILAKLLWDMVGPEVDPLSPNNVIMFGAGLLTGTLASSSGRTTITFKSPATRGYFKSNVGGNFGLYMKMAGYDIIAIHGGAPKPVYVYIEDDHIEIKDASALVQKDIRETYHILSKKYGDEVGIAAIGPAGENLVKISSMMCSVYNAAARGGIGAVMGSKSLKAMVVKGKGEVKVARVDEFHDLAIHIREKIENDEAAQIGAKYGTSATFADFNDLYAIPYKNFQINHVKKEIAWKYGGRYLAEAGYLKGCVACAACPIGCHRHTRVDSGKYAGTNTVGPEYETFSSFGGCLIDTDAVIKANDLCNIYGLDTISTGGVIQWAMECYEKGVLKKEDIDGLDLSWGNDETVLELIRKIAYREGFGDILAEGSKVAAEKVGKNSWKWAVQTKGLEHSRVDTRQAKAYALAFAVNPRGPDHLHTETIVDFAENNPSLERVVEKITGHKEYAKIGIPDGRPEIVRWHEDIYAITDCLGLCAFLTTSYNYPLDKEDLAKLFCAVTDINITPEELMLAGRRIVTLERCYNIRVAGYSRKDDILPYRIMNEPVWTPQREKQVTSKEELDAMLDRYYELHEWDIKTGMPTKDTLMKLGLNFVIEKIKKKGGF